MVRAVLKHPDEQVRTAVWTVVPGGEKTLRQLLTELMANNRVVRERVRYQLRGSYSHHYRRMLGPVLGALTFKCNNKSHRPVMDAIDLLARYATADEETEQTKPKKPKATVYAADDAVPIEGVVPRWPPTGYPPLIPGRQVLITRPMRAESRLPPLTIRLPAQERNTLSGNPDS
jgi:hypothetical protein